MAHATCYTHCAILYAAYGRGSHLLTWPRIYRWKAFLSSGAVQRPFKSWEPPLDLTFYLPYTPPFRGDSSVFRLLRLSLPPSGDLNEKIFEQIVGCAAA